jgi:hypothetical protein
LRWSGTIHEVRDELELDADQYPDAAVLAFIHIESSGDPHARRPGSAFHGLMQIARPYMKDAFYSDDVDPGELMGNGALSVETFLRYMERYSEWHDYDPIMMAVAHKGGCSTAKTADLLEDAGRDIDEAIAIAGKKHRVPRLELYVERYRAALTAYGEWVDKQNGPLGVCANEVLDG